MKRFLRSLGLLALLALAPLADTGLLFPGNDATTSTRFNFTSPPSMFPFSAVWQYAPFQQTGYYTVMFYARNDGAAWGCPAYDDFWVTHPYPFDGAIGTVHNFEIATACLDDTTDDGGHHPPRVTKGTLASPAWYSQGVTVSNPSGTTLEVKYYYNLPDTTYVIINSLTDNTTTPSTPGIIVGDAAWSPSNEQLSGIIRGLKMFSSNLSGTDLRTESLNLTADGATTTAGIANLWYSNVNPTPSDISDKSGAGHNPAWVGALKAEIWPRPTPTATVHSSIEAVSEVSSTTLETGSLECSGDNRFMVVLTGSTDGTPVAANAVRWGGSGGTSMTQRGTTISTAFARFNVWTLLAPTAQTSTVHATWGSAAGERSVIALCLEGVDQGDPYALDQVTGGGASVDLNLSSTTGTGDLLLGMPVWSEPCAARTLSMTAISGYAEHQQTTVQELDGADAGGCHGISVQREYTNEPGTVSSAVLSGTASWGQFNMIINSAAAAGAGSAARASLLGVGK